MLLFTDCLEKLSEKGSERGFDRRFGQYTNAKTARKVSFRCPVRLRCRGVRYFSDSFSRDCPKSLEHTYSVALWVDKEGLFGPFHPPYIQRGAFRSISSSVYQPNPRAERCSYPFRTVSEEVFSETRLPAFGIFGRKLRGRRDYKESRGLFIAPGSYLPLS